MGFSLGSIVAPAQSALSGISPLAAASAFGGYLSYRGQRAANEANQQLAAAQTQFQERMSNTAAQRAVKDYMKAGLNPMLVAKMGGASTPSGQTAVMQNPYSHSPDSAIKMASAQQALAQARKTNAEASVIEKTGLESAENQIIKAASEIGLNRQKAEDLYQSVRQREQDVFRIQDDRARIQALAKQIEHSTNLIKQQLATEVQKENLTYEQVSKTKQEKLTAAMLAGLYKQQAIKEGVSTEMLMFDLDALVKLEGMQKYVPIVQQIRAILK